MEFKTKQQATLPANMIAGDTWYLKINQAFFNEKFKYFVSLTEKEEYAETLIVEKKYQ